MSKGKGGLGRGLGALIPPKIAPAEQTAEAVIASAPETEISVDAIVENPHQPRTYFAPADLEDLVGSIKEHGILQPLLVTKRPDGTYELIAGERRLRSARLLGLKTVPAVVRMDTTDQQKLELALIENIQRADLNAVEEAQAYQSFVELFSLTHEQIAQRIGKSRSYVANAVRLLDLEPEIQQALMEGKISRSAARTLLSEVDQQKRREMFKDMLAGKMTVRQAEVKASGARPGGKREAKDANIRAIEDELRSALETKVELRMNGTTGKMTIHFYSKDDLKKLVKRLVG